MRYGVIADIHGNLPALRVVLAELRRHDVEAFLVAGDLVGYGPNPNECVEAIAELDAHCVAGNHDLIVVGRLSDERCIPLARESLRWTASVLGGDARTYLEGLPLRASVAGTIEIVHGSLDDPQEYTVGAEHAEPQLQRLERERGESALLVVGHTHRPLVCGLRSGRLRVSAERVVVLPHREPVLVNPGAVGQSREFRAFARGLLLDAEAREARFLRLRYDIQACRRDLRRVGLLSGSCHLRPSLPGAVRRVRGKLHRTG